MGGENCFSVIKWLNVSTHYNPWRHFKIRVDQIMGRGQ